MNNIAFLVYETVELVRGVKTVTKVEKKKVFCSVNSLSFESKANLQNNDLKATTKCTINNYHDVAKLSHVLIKDVKYTVVSVDRFKESDTITLLLNEVL